MMRFTIAFALALSSAAPAWAAMTAEEFEAYVEGQTLTFADEGQVYGAEEYLPGRRVRWAFVGDQCEEGIWYESEGQICFLYESNPGEPQCWVFTEENGRLSAQFEGNTEGRKLYEAARSDEPLQCLGPDVGV